MVDEMAACPHGESLIAPIGDQLSYVEMSCYGSKSDARQLFSLKVVGPLIKSESQTK